MLINKKMSGRSSTSVHNAIVNVVPIVFLGLLQLSKTLSPIVDVIQAINFFVDSILDPRGFASTMSRSGLNATCEYQTNAAKAVLQSPQYLQGMRDSIERLGPTLTPDEVERQVLIATSWYKKAYKYAPVTCYSEFVDANASGGTLDVTMSGAPTADCPPSYADAYDTFVTENRDKYVAEGIASSNNMVNAYNSLVSRAAEDTVDRARNEYTIELVIVGIIFFISLVVVLSLFLVQREREMRIK